MLVWVRDAQGVELVNDPIQVDGKDDFVWRLGLAPGSYTLEAILFSLRETQATLAFQVPAPGAEPHAVEVRLERR